MWPHQTNFFFHLFSLYRDCNVMMDLKKKGLRTWILKNVISSIKTYSISHFLAHLTRFIITWVLFWSLSVISQVNLFLIFSRFLKTFTGFNDVHPVILLNRMCVNLDPIKTTYRLHDGFSALHMYIKRERRSR